MPENEAPIGPSYNLSIVDVCNNALTEIGQNWIGSFEEDSPAANACRVFVPTVLRAMLYDTDWKFASRRVYLPQLSQERILQILAGFGGGGFGSGGFGGGMTPVTVTAVPGPYPLWYALPFDCIRPRMINDDHAFQFQVRGRILMSDQAPVYLDYTAYVDDPNTMDGGFQMAFELLLASRLAARLTKDIKLAADLLGKYAQANEQAKQVNFQIGSPPKLTSRYFLYGRE